MMPEYIFLMHGDSVATEASWEPYPAQTAGERRVCRWQRPRWRRDSWNAAHGRM